MLTAYRWASTLGVPLIRLYLSLRMARGKEDGVRFGERLGRPGRPRPDGPLVWVHAASVGESMSMVPLIGRLLDERPGLRVLMTTGTVTSARLMAERLPEGALHQYVPVDRVAYVRRFLDHWQPDLVLWAESEFWPNLVGEPAARGIPAILINGRVSPRSFAGWRRFEGSIARLLSGFQLCLGQTEADTRRLVQLGAAGAKCLGNIKFAAPPLPADPGKLEGLEKAVGVRPLWLAASTHPGEEETAGRVHGRLKAGHPGLLTVLVPRHPERGAGIAAALLASGHAVSLRSAGEAITPATDIYVADTLGELGLFYRLAGVVFVGKSLVPQGGQNPLEAARLDCALIHGPHMTNFEDIARALAAGGASLVVDGEAGLAAALERLLGDEGERKRRADAARVLAAAETGVLDAVMAELAPFLSGIQGHAGS